MRALLDGLLRRLRAWRASRDRAGESLELKPTAERIQALASALEVPALRLVSADVPARSHFGGSPSLPRGVEWPTREGRRLAFLVRMDLEELQTALPIDWLPSAGALLFFYDVEKQPWGFDPSDGDGWCVLLLDAAEARCDPLVEDALGLRFRPLAFRRSRSLLLRHGLPLPNEGRPILEQLPEKEVDALFDLQVADFEGRPKHQVSGDPIPVQQDEMELECQLVSNGIYCGNSSGYRDPRAAELREGADEWRLLLQFDSDDELGVMWGDLGTLYFWVRESEARRGDFSGVWLVLQCG